MSALGYAVSDTVVVARRSLLRIPRQPDLLLGFTVQPVMFISSAFVPVDSMPGWLHAFAKHNPITTMVDAARALFLGTPAGNDVWLSVVWALGIVAVFGPLSAWRYRRAVMR